MTNERTLLREMRDALVRAWNARTLPADVISGDLFRRVDACLADEPPVTLTLNGPSSWSHQPGCPVLSAAGNPQCTCPPTGAPQSKRVEFYDEQGRRCTRWE